MKSIEVMSHSTTTPSVGVQVVLDRDNSLDWFRVFPSSVETRSFKWLLTAIHKWISVDHPFGTPFAFDVSVKNLGINLIEMNLSIYRRL